VTADHDKAQVLTQEPNSRARDEPDGTSWAVPATESHVTGLEATWWTARPSLLSGRPQVRVLPGARESAGQTGYSAGPAGARVTNEVRNLGRYTSRPPRSATTADVGEVRPRRTPRASLSRRHRRSPGREAPVQVPGVPDPAPLNAERLPEIPADDREGARPRDWSQRSGSRPHGSGRVRARPQALTCEPSDRRQRPRHTHAVSGVGRAGARATGTGTPVTRHEAPSDCNGRGPARGAFVAGRPSSTKLASWPPKAPMGKWRGCRTRMTSGPSCMSGSPGSPDTSDEWRPTPP
jgi:hypothetical protein